MAKISFNYEINVPSDDLVNSKPHNLKMAKYLIENGCGVRFSNGRHIINDYHEFAIEMIAYFVGGDITQSEIDTLFIRKIYCLDLVEFLMPYVDFPEISSSMKFSKRISKIALKPYTGYEQVIYFLLDQGMRSDIGDEKCREFIRTVIKERNSVIKVDD